LLVSVTGESAGQSFINTPPGDYYLEINAENITWEITAKEIR